jgi:predicted ATPase/class 3 adenylate cyclase
VSADHPTVETTFLFTDVEGSTRYWIEHPDDAGAAFARHDQLLTESIEAVFESPRAGLEAAVAAQLSLRSESDELGSASMVRMGLHIGQAEARDDDFYGMAPIVSARLMSTAHGGQLLITDAIRRTVGELPAPLQLVDLGEHRLKDLAKPEHVFQVVHPDLRTDFPPINSLPRIEYTLPSQLTRFVGRRTELEAIQGLLHDQRLLTLIGSGGVGKTRLAVEAAESAVGDYPEGIWFVDLGPVSDPGLVPAAVAGRVGIPESVDRSPTDQLSEHFIQRRALLILDNCEHLLESCADLVDRLLRASGELHVLVTSRERLGLESETIYRVPSMAVPGADDQGPEATADIDSVRLFVDRAARSSPGFELTDDNASAVAAITRHLDGIPLAIELAAAKVVVLTPDEIARRLDDRFRLLRGRRGGDSRHQTLQATIDWGYGLLDEDEKSLFDQLSVFRGGFDVEAVRAVCAASDPQGVFDLLLALVEKSLVLRADEEDRFGLLETLREYAAQRLGESEMEPQVVARHAEYFTALAEETRARLYGPNQAAWLNRLSLEHDNLRAALSHSLAAENASAAGRIAAASWAFWKVRGHLSEGRGWLASVLALPGPLDPSLRTDLLLGAAELAIDQGDLESGSDCLESALELAVDGGSIRDAATIKAKMASLPHKAGDLEGAIALSEEALEMAAEAGDDWVTSRVLPNLALLYEDQGDHARAARLAEEAVALGRESGNPYLIADAALSAGEIALNREDAGAARASFEEALENAQEVGISDVGAWSLAYLGKLAIAEGDYRRARTFLEGSIRQFDELDYPIGSSWALCHLGRALQGEADFAEARRRLEEALRLARAYVQPDVPIAIEGLGAVAAAAGASERAVVLLAAANSIRTRFGLELAAPERRESERAWADLQDAMASDRLEELRTRGNDMTLDEAVSYALEPG